MRLFRRRPHDDVPLRFEAREVEGPPLPERELHERETIAGVRFEPRSRWVDFERCRLEGVDFSGLGFDVLRLFDCRVDACDFSRVRIEWSPFASGTTFTRCRFDGARLADIAGRVRFERCSFDRTRLAWIAFDADVVECRFTGAPSLVLHGRGNEVRGNDFRDADVSDVGFRRGVDVRAQLLPDGVVYLDRFSRRTKRARRAISAWPDEEERRLALGIIESLRIPSDEQEEIVTTRAKWLGLYPAEVVDRTLAVLAES